MIINMQQTVISLFARLSLCLALTAATVHAAPQAQSGGDAGVKRTILNRGWDFKLEDDPEKSSWQSVHLPHTFSLPYFMSDTFYTGKGTYRKTLNVPASWKGKKVFLECGAAFQVAQVDVNGHIAGRHEGGYTSFRVDLSPWLKEGNNEITVKVDNRWSPRIAPRAGEHVFSGGLYRNVYLHVCDPVHIPLHGVWIQTPEVSSRQAKVAILTDVKNDSAVPGAVQVRHAVYDPNSRTPVLKGSQVVKLSPGGAASVKVDMPALPNPKLWSPATPFVYRVETEIVSPEGIVLDKAVNPLGVRSIRLTPDKGMLINGKSTYLQGANVHQDHAGWGDAVTEAGSRRDVRLMKEAGFNFIRGSHYPHSGGFMDACDTEGMCMLKEGIFWGMGGAKEHDQYWNCDAYPREEKDRAAFEESCMRQVREMVMEFRNHPSVVIWSISNEPFFTKDTEEAKQLCNKLIDLVRQLDPTRPVCAGGGQRGAFDQLGDLGAFNGDGCHAKTPGRPSMVSEYGSVACKRPGEYAPGWGDMTKSKENKEIFPWRIGEAVWCGFDHGSIWGSGARMGIVDYFRIPKRGWYWYRNHLTKQAPPAWPEQGTPKGLKISADKKTISPADGTDDVHIMVKVTDASGKHIANEVPITLTVQSGPGEFPTGKSITFQPGTDIDMIEGCAAIEFRSYYAGKTTIKASSPGLQEDTIQIISKGAPAYVAGKSQETAERPYKRFTKEDREKLMAQNGDSAKVPEEAPNLATFRPCTASSNQSDAMKAADGDARSAWTPAGQDKNPWWMLDMEFEFDLADIALECAKAPAGAIQIQISRDRKNWTPLKPENTPDGKGVRAVCPAGTKAKYVRVGVPGGQGITELNVRPVSK